MVEEEQIRAWLREFVDGTNRTRHRAGELELAIDEAFSEDERFADLLYALAVYAPEGGEFLYGEAELVKECAHALRLLTSTPTAP
jgi:hypothetical protein